MLTPQETIGSALDCLSRGIQPFFERELAAAYGPDWKQVVRQASRADWVAHAEETAAWDSHMLLAVMWDHWNAVFRKHLGLFERSLVSELREFRNRWAHQADLSIDDAYRVVDGVQRLLDATGTLAGEQEVLDQLKWDLLRNKLGRKVNQDLLRAQANRARLVDIGLYGLAALAVILTTLVGISPNNPLGGAILCLFTLISFGYIISNRWKIAIPVYGVHECLKCRKVIYTEVCPYCEATRYEGGQKGLPAATVKPPATASRPTPPPATPKPTTPAPSA